MCSGLHFQRVFRYVAPKAAHEPFNPAPWYVDHWEEDWPTSEPRDNPAWNCSAESRADHHGVCTIVTIPHWHAPRDFGCVPASIRGPFYRDAYHVVVILFSSC
jgi:hypothetical protein